MMRFIFFIAVLFLTSCKNEERNLKPSGKTDLIETVQNLEENQVQKVILFENGFDQDTVRLAAGKNLIFEGVITTDPRTGSAHSLEIELPDSFEVLDFKMNKWKKKINLSDSTFVHINKIAFDSIEVVYNNKFGGYY